MKGFGAPWALRVKGAGLPDVGLRVYRILVGSDVRL